MSSRFTSTIWREMLVAMLDDDNVDSRVIEIGGSQALSIESLMRAIRRAKAGAAGKVVHLLVGPIAACLGVMGPLVPGPPVTAGQLASSAVRVPQTQIPGASNAGPI